MKETFILILASNRFFYTQVKLSSYFKLSSIVFRNSREFFPCLRALKTYHIIQNLITSISHRCLLLLHYISLQIYLLQHQFLCHFCLLIFFTLILSSLPFHTLMLNFLLSFVIFLFYQDIIPGGICTYAHAQLRIVSRKISFIARMIFIKT